jgi:acetyltransferase
VIAHGAEPGAGGWPRPAIRPYPRQYVAPWTAKDGTALLIRPIRPEDEPLMVAFHKTLSERSVYMRYFRIANLDYRIAHDRLTRICFIDYDREMALVAERAGEIVAVARLTRLPGTPDAEFSLLVSDAVQGQGLGRAMLERLFDVGRDWGISRIVAEILPQNAPMRRVCVKLGFRFEGETTAI